MTPAGHDPCAVGEELHRLIARLFPICRSMTGNGVRQTLNILQEIAPIEIREVASGTQVFDWTVPPEWNVRDAFVKDANGRRVIDFKASNLHLVNGSRPIRQSMRWSALSKHLHTIPDQTGRIPYRTCYFKDEWGFCLSQNDFDRLEAAGDRIYDVVVDTTVAPGSLTYGEVHLPGKSDETVLISAHLCHPSLANDNLSGLCVAALLAHRLSLRSDRRLGYRFLFAPATIGAITWLAQNQETLGKIRHGLVLSLLGDPGCSTYKRSRSGNARIDNIVEHVLKTSGDPFDVRDFAPFGYDERQFCSPGINLPMGCLMRTPSAEFEQYHTSADDLGFVEPPFLADSFAKCLSIVDILENDVYPINTRPFGEPRLDRHGLYEGPAMAADRRDFQQAVQWVLNLGDGDHSLFDIAMRSNMPFQAIQEAAERLAGCGLVTVRSG